MKYTHFLVPLILWVLLPLPVGKAASISVSGHKRVAILVSVDQYKDGAQDERLRWLKGCHQDLEAMRKTLQEDYKFDVVELRNESATKGNILKILKEVASKVTQPNDRIVFYFSGLGSLDAYGKPTLCPYDARSEDSKNDIRANDLSEWVHERLKKVDNITLILDCAFTEPPAGKGAPVRPKFFNRHPQQVPDSGVIRDALNGIVKRKGVLLSACQPEEGAWETLRRKDRSTGREIWAGIFSRQLVRRLETLKGAQLSYRELVEWVKSDVRAYVADALYSNPDYRQTPGLFGQEKYKDRVLFSPQPAPPPNPQRPGYVPVALRDEGDGASVRLRIAFYGQDATWGQQLKKRIERQMPHVQLVEREESADQSLHIYQTGTDLRAYLVDANRVPIGQPFTKAPNDFNGLLQEINARLNDLMSYRWAESLRSKDPASFDVETLALGPAGAESSPRVVRQSEASVPIRLKVNRDGYFTLLLVNPRGTVITVYPTRADQDNSVKAHQPIDDLELHPNRLPTGRWKLIAVATREKVPCDEVLEYVYQSSSPSQKLAYADARLGKGEASLPADSDTRIEPLRPNFIKPTGKGATRSAANVQYAIRVTHFSVVE